MSHKPRVLVVEDERTIAQAIAARLEAEGFAVNQAHDGLAALERAAAWNPELVVHLTVADEGPGIAAADRSAVFERFTTSAGHSSGTGLGLTIARWVAQLHGGTIAVADSERGCRIQLTLPAGALRPTATRKEPVMSTLTPPAPAPQTPQTSTPPPGLTPSGLTTYWPDAPRRRPGIVAAAAVAGALAATVLPGRDLGLGTSLVFAAVVGTVFVARTTRTTRAAGPAGPDSTPSTPPSWRCCSRHSSCGTRSGSRCCASWPPWR